MNEFELKQIDPVLIFDLINSKTALLELWRFFKVFGEKPNNIAKKFTNWRIGEFEEADELDKK